MDEFWLQKCLNLAVEYHAGQFRDGGLPYVIHPIQVASMLHTWGLSTEKFPEVWGAGFLHDVLEDNKTITAAMIAERTNKETASLVEALTFRNKEESESDMDYRLAKEAYLLSFATKPIKAVVIKESDRICNVRDFMVSSPGYASKYFRKADAFFKIVDKRSPEIAETFGVDFMIKARQAYVDLRRDLQSLDNELALQRKRT
jgi:(p)ppGpp synthase/HD superfamily hydrolase